MSVVWSPEAEADLREIRDYIAADNPRRATSFVEEIVDAGEAIADMPRAFPLVNRLEHKGIRRRGYGSYLLFYRIGIDDRIEILHVAHGARDYIRALFSDG